RATLICEASPSTVAMIASILRESEASANRSWCGTPTVFSDSLSASIACAETRASMTRLAGDRLEHPRRGVRDEEHLGGLGQEEPRRRADDDPPRGHLDRAAGAALLEEGVQHDAVVARARLGAHAQGQRLAGELQLADALEADRAADARE